MLSLSRREKKRQVDNKSIAFLWNSRFLPFRILIYVLMLQNIPYGFLPLFSEFYVRAVRLSHVKPKSSFIYQQGNALIIGEMIGNSNFEI